MGLLASHGIMGEETEKSPGMSEWLDQPLAGSGSRPVTFCALRMDVHNIQYVPLLEPALLFLSIFQFPLFLSFFLSLLQ